MKKCTLVVLALLVVLATPRIVAAEVSTSTILGTAEICSVPIGVNECSDERNRLILSSAGCLVGAVGFFKAAKTMKAVAKGIRGGGSTKAIIFGAVGAFFCTDVYNSYWEWRDCDNGMQDRGGLLDSIHDPRIFLFDTADADDLADEFDDAADLLAQGIMP